MSLAVPRQILVRHSSAFELYKAEDLQPADSPTARMSGTQKSPNIGTILAPSVLPGVLIEPDWNESIEDLHNDMHEWLIGGNGCVRAVIILKWNGFAELYKLDSSGTPYLTQTEVRDP